MCLRKLDINLSIFSGNGRTSLRRGRAAKIHVKQDAKVADLISRFEKFCTSKGWEAYEDSDSIEAEGECLKRVWVNKQKLCEEVI